MSTAKSIATQATPASLSTFAATLPGRIILGLAATAVVALAAHIAIPLPFTPVPLIMTPLAVLGVGLAFGPTAGFAILLAYLLEGACGLPVFSPTGTGGLFQLLGPTGGYLMAYPVVAAIAGGLTKPLSLTMPRFLASFLACTAAMLVLFASGAGWFLHITHVSLHTALTMTVLPFLPGEIVKTLAAAGIYSTLTRTRNI